MILTTKIVRQLGLILIVTIMVLSCSKDGNEGPMGPQGEQGDPGEDGTANVIYSEWIDENLSNVGSFHSQFLDEISIEEFDAFTDLVLTYGRINSGNESVFLVPFYRIAQTTSLTTFWPFIKINISSTN
ncbi:hypothetical protein [Maribacter sp. 4G9]|uniref:hypothetical protein n=1 Tax=Maribacter sp. 4G9 TaxID=1889777 RepID=UPI000C151A1D|nr:hypothetical protein [Maribacter sp. 4G9]PIB38422.1 hypothetical protein BFP75_16065 [Maribacter sp. 4G9]